MTVLNWSWCWVASVFHAQVGVDGRAPVRIGSSPTKATAIRAVVGCSESGRSRTPFRSDATSERVAPPGLVARWPSTRWPTRVGTSWSAASTASSSGAGWRRATRSVRPITGQWWSSRPSSSGSTPESSDGPLSAGSWLTKRIVGSTYPDCSAELDLVRGCLASGQTVNKHELRLRVFYPYRLERLIFF